MNSYMDSSASSAHPGGMGLRMSPEPPSRPRGPSSIPEEENYVRRSGLWECWGQRPKTPSAQSAKAAEETSSHRGREREEGDSEYSCS